MLRGRHALMWSWTVTFYLQLEPASTQESIQTAEHRMACWCARQWSEGGTARTPDPVADSTLPVMLLLVSERVPYARKMPAPHCHTRAHTSCHVHARHPPYACASPPRGVGLQHLQRQAASTRESIARMAEHCMACWCAWQWTEGGTARTCVPDADSTLPVMVQLVSEAVPPSM